MGKLAWTLRKIFSKLTKNNMNSEHNLKLENI